MKQKIQKVVVYLKAHLKAEVAGAVSLGSFLIAHNLVSMSADRSAAVMAILTWVSVHVVPNIPTEG